jgi:hypothetical protein
VSETDKDFKANSRENFLTEEERERRIKAFMEGRKGPDVVREIHLDPDKSELRLSPGDHLVFQKKKKD